MSIEETRCRIQARFEQTLRTFDFSNTQKIALGVSGGADSMALALMALEFQKHSKYEFIAFVVDHKLRPTSTKEALFTCDCLKKRGLQTKLLTWEGEKPVSGIEKTARKARYRLFEEACKEENCSVLLLGHHKQDQAETFLIRKAKQSGEIGLAGMSVVRQTSFGRIIRPLLNISPQELKAINQAYHQEWVEDETNHSTEFERGRLRQTLTPEEIDFAFKQTLFYGKKRQAIEQEALLFVQTNVLQSPMGFILFSKDAFACLAHQTQRYVLGTFLRLTANREYAPSCESLNRLTESLLKESFKKSTLSGCCIAPTTKRQVLIWRELSDLPAQMKIINKQHFFWDRYSFFLDEPLPTELTIGPLKDAFTLKKSFPKQTFSSLPALFDKEGLFIVPHLEYKRNKITCLASLRTPSLHEIFSSWTCPIQ